MKWQYFGEKRTAGAVQPGAGKTEGFKAHITALHDSRIETETRRIVDKLKDLSAPNSPNKTHFMVEISPHFDALAQQTLSKLERMTDTDYDNQKFNFTDE